MTDPKKLVPPCVCSPILETAAALREPQREANALPAAEMGLGRFVETPPPPAEDAPQAAPEAPLEPPPLAPADAAAAFVGESCKPNRKAFTSTAEIMAAARGWCDEHGAMPFGPRTLAGQLRRMGGQPHSNGQRRGWRGIKLR